YIETINLIYSNTIHIRRIYLIQNIDKFLLPQRLATIKSLELVWELSTMGALLWSYLDETPPTEENLDPEVRRALSLYTALMAKIPQTFPSISNLHISISVTTYIANPLLTTIATLQHHLFAPADATARSLGSQLHAFQITPNASLYKALARRATEQGAREEKGPSMAPFWRRFWRSVDSDDDRVTGNVGYWVGRGKDDTPVW
ncbi:MAG: hypothetical protein Q9200_004413, partial [Gallowayella weberi]